LFLAVRYYASVHDDLTEVATARRASAAQLAAATLSERRSVPGEFRFVDRVFITDVRRTLMDVPGLNVRGRNFASRLAGVFAVTVRAGRGFFQQGGSH
jgi:hypothetical protein